MRCHCGLQDSRLSQGDAVDDCSTTQRAESEWLGTLDAATHMAAVEEQNEGLKHENIPYERMQQQQQQHIVVIILLKFSQYPAVHTNYS